MASPYPKRAFVNVPGGTDFVVVPAVPGKAIRVLQVILVAGGTATDLTFNSKGSGAGVAISPLFANAANGGGVLPYSPVGWFASVQGEALTVTSNGGSTVGVLIGYDEH